jgi:hypothetical protein
MQDFLYESWRIFPGIRTHAYDGEPTLLTLTQTITGI